MIAGKSVLAIIPARGGSKGVPRKNVRDVAGKPLIAWTIEEAKKSQFIDRLILSSEDIEIIEVAKDWGCEVPFIRPKELSQDHTPGIDPVLHALMLLPGYDYIVLLQPTSPLRNAADIDSCIEICVKHGVSSCVSVTEPDASPYWMYHLGSQNQLIPLFTEGAVFSRRQDLPKTYSLNGAVYVARCSVLISRRTFVGEDTVAYIMPKIRSVDIDTELDLEYARAIIESF